MITNGFLIPKENGSYEEYAINPGTHAKNAEILINKMHLKVPDNMSAEDYLIRILGYIKIRTKYPHRSLTLSDKVNRAGTADEIIKCEYPNHKLDIVPALPNQ